MAWVENLLQRAMSLQRNLLFEYPEGKRKEGYGRAARLVIDGEGGGIFDLWFTEAGIVPKPEGVELRNTIYMSEETLLDLVTPDVDLGVLAGMVKGSIGGVAERLYPRLDPRVARANGLIKISGDTSLYDSEEMAQIWDRAVLKVFFPIIIKSMLRREHGRGSEKKGRRGRRFTSPRRNSGETAG